MRNAKTEDLRQQLHQYIDIYGLSDTRTIQLSKKLDLSILEVYRGEES